MTQLVSLWGEAVDVPLNAKGQAILEGKRPAARTPDQKRKQASDREGARRQAGNPMLAAVGPGPEGKTCNGCCHLLRMRYHGKTYTKCELRKIAHSTATDHRVKWPACAKFRQIDWNSAADSRNASS